MNQTSIQSIGADEVIVGVYGTIEDSCITL